MGVFTGPFYNQHPRMHSKLVLLVSLAVLLSLFLPAIEAAAARRRGKAGRRGAVSSSQRGKQGRRGRVQGRRGRVQARRGRVQARRGRQDADVAADDANAVDGEEEELHNGCDWKTNIGGFLTFCKWRKWCADEKGITDFGPYGGVPEACPSVADEEGEEEEE